MASGYVRCGECIRTSELVAKCEVSMVQLRLMDDLAQTDSQEIQTPHSMTRHSRCQEYLGITKVERDGKSTSKSSKKRTC